MAPSQTHNTDNFPFNTMLQWNCRSLYNKRYELKELINTIKPLTICLQETYNISDKDMNEIKELFKNFTFYFKFRDRSGQHNPCGGVAIMIHKDVPHKIKVLNTNLESIALDIKFRNKEISLCSLYLAPNRNFSYEELVNLSDQLLEHHILMGDFNAHNITWGSIHTDNKGIIIGEFINNTNNVLLNTGEPTRICPITDNYSHIDLSLSTPRLSLDIVWSTFTDTLRSDHFPII